MSVLVISEIGVNHGGSESEAHSLIAEAKVSGADCVKLQLFKPELFPASQQKMLEKLQLPLQSYKNLNKYCSVIGMKFAVTAFDCDSLEWLLKNTNMAFIKIASPSIHDKKLLAVAATAKKPIVISTGMCEYKDMTAAERILRGCDITFLWCVSQYPTPSEKARLKKMIDLKRMMQRPVGISDHSGDIFVPLAAVAMGAKTVECHLTMSKDLLGPDHKSSLEPQQFKQMVTGIRILEKALA